MGNNDSKNASDMKINQDDNDVPKAEDLVASACSEAECRTSLDTRLEDINDQISNDPEIEEFRQLLNSCSNSQYSSALITNYSFNYAVKSPDILNTFLTISLQNLYDNFSTLKIHRVIYYEIYKAASKMPNPHQLFPYEFENIFKIGLSKIKENRKWDEIVMYGALLCELKAVYEESSFYICKNIDRWVTALSYEAADGNDNAMIAFLLILKRLLKDESSVRDDPDGFYGVFKILLEDGSSESKKQKISDQLDTSRLLRFADTVDEIEYEEEVSRSQKCKYFEKFFQLNSDNVYGLDINKFSDITDYELEFLARKFIEVAVNHPNRMNFLVFVLSKYQRILTRIRSVINKVIREIEKELVSVKSGNPKYESLRTCENLAEFIGELYFNKNKIISSVLMTNWLSYWASSTSYFRFNVIAVTLKRCAFLYKFDDPKNFDILIAKMKNFAVDEVGRELIAEIVELSKIEITDEMIENRIFKSAPTARKISDLEKFLDGINNHLDVSYDYRDLDNYKLKNPVKNWELFISKSLASQANPVLIAQFLKAFLKFSYTIGKIINRLKANIESKISKMSLDNHIEMLNIGKFIAELRNYVVIEKISQNKWLQKIDSLKPLENQKVLEIQLNILKIMMTNIVVHQKETYIKYLQYIQLIKESSVKYSVPIDLKISEIIENLITPEIDSESKNALYLIKSGQQCSEVPKNLPLKDTNLFDLEDFTKLFFLNAIANKFATKNYLNYVKSLEDNHQADNFRALLKKLCHRHLNLLMKNVNHSDYSEVIAVIKFITLFNEIKFFSESEMKTFSEMLEKHQDSVVGRVYLQEFLKNLKKGDPKSGIVQRSRRIYSSLLLKDLKVTNTETNESKARSRRNYSRHYLLSNRNDDDDAEERKGDSFWGEPSGINAQNVESIRPVAAWSSLFPKEVEKINNTFSESDEIPKHFCLNSQDLLLKFRQLSDKSDTGDITSTVEQVLLSTTKSVEAFKNFALNLQIVLNENPNLKQIIDKFIKLLTKELNQNHKNLIDDLCDDIRNSLTYFNKKKNFDNVNERELFLVSVEALIQVIRNALFYNIMDELLARIKCGSPRYIELFLDIFERTNYILKEDSKQCNAFVPLCINILSISAMHKGTKVNERMRISKAVKNLESQIKSSNSNDGSSKIQNYNENEELSSQSTSNAINTQPNEKLLEQKLNCYINELNSSNVITFSRLIAQILPNDPSNIIRRKSFEMLLTKGTSDVKNVEPVIKIFQIVINKKKDKFIVGDIFYSAFTEVCERKEGLTAKDYNLVRLTKALITLIKNDVISAIWKFVFESIKMGNSHLFPLLVLLVDGNVEIFYKTNVNELLVKEFLEIFESKNQEIKDEQIKKIALKIMEDLQSGVTKSKISTEKEVINTDSKTDKNREISPNNNDNEKEGETSGNTKNITIPKSSISDRVPQNLYLFDQGATNQVKKETKLPTTVDQKTSQSSDRNKNSLDFLPSDPIVQNLHDLFIGLSETEDMSSTIQQLLPSVTKNVQAVKIYGQNFRILMTFNPNLRPIIGKFTLLLSRELNHNYKTLMNDLNNDLENQMLLVGKGNENSKKPHKLQFLNDFVSVVKLVSKTSFYNVLDDILAKVKNGNQTYLVLFVDIVDVAKDELTETSKERDRFIPSWISTLKKATKFKSPDNVKSKTCETLKFFEGQKINVTNLLRNMKGAAVGTNQLKKPENTSSTKQQYTSVIKTVPVAANSQNTGVAFSGQISSQNKITASQNPSNFDQQIQTILTKLDSSNVDAISATILGQLPANPSNSEKSKVLELLLEKGISNQRFIKPVIKLLLCVFQNLKLNETKGLMTRIITKKLSLIYTSNNVPSRKDFDLVQFANTFEPQMTNSEFFFLCSEMKIASKNKNQVFPLLVFLLQNKVEILNSSRRKRLFNGLHELFKSKIGTLKDEEVRRMALKILKEMEQINKNGGNSSQTTAKGINLAQSTIFSNRLRSNSSTSNRQSRSSSVQSYASQSSGNTQSNNRKRNEHISNIEKSLQLHVNKLNSKNAIQISVEIKKIFPNELSNIARRRFLQIILDKGTSDENLIDPIKDLFLNIFSGANFQKSAVTMFDVISSKFMDVCEGGRKMSPKNYNLAKFMIAFSPFFSTSSVFFIWRGVLDYVKAKNFHVFPLLVVLVDADIELFYETKEGVEHLNDFLIIFKANLGKLNDNNLRSKAVRIINDLESGKVESKVKGNKIQKDSNVTVKEKKNSPKPVGTASNLKDSSSESEKPCKPAVNNSQNGESSRFPSQNPDPNDINSFSNENCQNHENEFTDQNSNLSRSSSEDSNNNLQMMMQSLQEQLDSLKNSTASSFKPQINSKHCIKYAIFTSDSFLFDESTTNTDKFREIIKNLITKNVYDEQDTSSLPKIAENIALAIVKIQFLKIDENSNDFKDLMDIFLSFLVADDDKIKTRFILTKFLKALKVSDIDKHDEATACNPSKSDRFSKLVCKFVKSFVNEVPENVQAGFDTFAFFYSNFIDKFQNYLYDDFYNTEEYFDLVCDLFLENVISSEFVIAILENYMIFFDVFPYGFKIFGKIVRKTGALLQLYEAKRLDAIFDILSATELDDNGTIAELLKIHENRWSCANNFTPICLQFHENPESRSSIIETLWAHLMKCPQNYIETSNIVEQLWLHLDENFKTLIVEFMSKRRSAFEAIPQEMFKVSVQEKLEGTILFIFELFTIGIVDQEMFQSWIESEMLSKISEDGRLRIQKKIQMKNF